MASTSADEARRPIVVFVLGGPGAGKGTQCEKIQSEYKYVHISAGDCLREERSTPGSQYGEMIEDHIKNGLIVPVEVTVELLIKKMKASGWDGGKFLIDGFPRNENNLDGWLKCMKIGETDCKDPKNAFENCKVDVRACLFFECKEDEMERRLLQRGEASGRSDDNIESIRKRFRTFLQETMPIVERFRSIDRLRGLNGMRSVDDVWEDVRKVFDEIDRK